jgi:hypothetical protein
MQIILAVRPLPFDPAESMITFVFWIVKALDPIFSLGQHAPAHGAAVFKYERNGAH